MVLLQSHYRGPVSIGQDNIDAAVKALAGLDAFAARTATVVGGGIATIGIVGFFWSRFPSLRRIDRFEELSPE